MEINFLMMDSNYAEKLQITNLLYVKLTPFEWENIDQTQYGKSCQTHCPLCMSVVLKIAATF